MALQVRAEQMSKFASNSKTAGIIAAVLVVVAAGVWWGSRPPASDSQNPTPGSNTGPFTLSSGGSPAPTGSTGIPHDPFFVRRGHTEESNTPATQSTVNPPVAGGNVLTNWEDNVDQILTSTNEDADKAKQMLGMFPNLPPDGQVEVAQHMANLMPDQDYASLASLLTNSALPEDVLDVLLADALNRPNSVKLPTLLGVARDPQNPKAPEARELLQLFLDNDYGNDWTTWQSKMDDWLKENPD
jgi:hypothetical protein